MHRGPESLFLRTVGRMRTSLDSLPMSGGQGVASSNLASPTRAIHPIRLSRTCIQLTLLPLDNAERRACPPRHLRVLPSRRSCGSGAPRTPQHRGKRIPNYHCCHCYHRNLLIRGQARAVGNRLGRRGSWPPSNRCSSVPLSGTGVSDAAPVTERAGCCGLGGTGSADRRWP
jgi:hypothetical protein